MLVGLDEAGLHSMHAIMPSTSCHDLKRWPAVVVVAAAAAPVVEAAAAAVVVVCETWRAQRQRGYMARYVS